jgi:hypothetical protein
MKFGRSQFIILATIVVIFCGVATWMLGKWGVQTMNKERTAAAQAGDAFLQDIAHAWSFDDLSLHAGARLLTSQTDDELKDYLEKMDEELGAYVSGEGTVSTLREGEDMNGDPVMLAAYECYATFEKQDALVNMVLSLREVGDWSIDSLGFTPAVSDQETPESSPSPDQ